MPTSFLSVFWPADTHILKARAETAEGIHVAKKKLGPLSYQIVFRNLDGIKHADINWHHHQKLNPEMF